MKPRVNAKSIPWLMAIWERVIESDYYRAADANLRQAPSDVLDGWAIPSEVADLVRRRVLCVIPVRKEDQTSVSPVTWDFTDRGIAIFRAWIAGRPSSLPTVYAAANGCPNCGAPLDEGMEP